MATQRSGASAEPASVEARDIVVWDVPTRLFHWTLAVLIGMAWVSRKWGDAGLVWHTWNGYAILILVVWRLLWGFVGTSTARFGSFFYWPWTAARYGLDFVLRRPRHFLGHNPLGGTVVFALLILVGGQALLGLFAYDDHDSNAGGPLAGQVSDAAWAWAAKWHVRVFDLLLYAIGLHVAASVLYLVWKRENLVKAMITGRKPAADYEDAAAVSVASTGRALICLAIAIVIVFGGIKLAGGKWP